MVSRKISIPLIIIVAAVVVLLVSINQPFQRAEANKGQELAATETFLQEPQLSDQEDQQSIVDSVAPTNDPDLPSIKLEEPTDLAKVNELLKGKINTTLLQPGWIQVIKEYTSLIETAATSTVPESGQVIPRDYRLEQWLLKTLKSSCNTFTAHPYLVRNIPPACTAKINAGQQQKPLRWTLSIFQTFWVPKHWTISLPWGSLGIRKLSITTKKVHA
ncbi:MAG: hypothetical protein CVU41_06525 [Chloroflexi bacterium HGW-Chloroflexi-3]|nr:MAG: hypothetical protein CVU41_06525 [Chloroflexi bacterium HGW-Chloroflexi-3]